MTDDNLEEDLQRFFSRQQHQFQASNGLFELIVKDLDGVQAGPSRFPNLWRCIMTSKSGRCTAAAAVILIVSWVFLFSPLTNSHPAWARVVADIKEANPLWPFWAKVSPFTEVQFDQRDIIVRYAGDRYALVAIEGIETDELIAVARKTFGEEKWQKRIAEDIVEVLEAAAVAPDTSVSLVLRDLKDGTRYTIDQAPMTRENRKAIWRQRHSVPTWARVSPFTQVDFIDGQITVEYDQIYYELVTIEGIQTQALIDTARQSFGESWQKRIAEDITEVLVAAGVTPAETVRLELRELEGHTMRTVDQAPMTKENRRAIMKSHY